MRSSLQTIRDAVLAELDTLTPRTSPEIAARLGIREHQARHALWYLASQGKAEQDGRIRKVGETTSAILYRLPVPKSQETEHQETEHLLNEAKSLGRFGVILAQMRPVASVRMEGRL
ncbi:hypothetical protein FMZ60_08550 [Alcaligenaceae bacterium SJ-26]|nr:hypothetical protein FMZ60_08550 [Alcaligenaceae bacterium SJ-26]